MVQGEAACIGLLRDVGRTHQCRGFVTSRAQEVRPRPSIVQIDDRPASDMREQKEVAEVSAEPQEQTCPECLRWT
jgi:hypothetical protein